MRRKASKPVCSEACTVRMWRLKPNAVAPRSRACKVPLWDARGTGQDARGTCGRSLAPAPNATDAERHRLGQTITFASWPTELAHGAGPRGWPTELAHGASPRKVAGMRRKASCAWVTAINYLPSDWVTVLKIPSIGAPTWVTSPAPPQIPDQPKVMALKFQPASVMAL